IGALGMRSGQGSASMALEILHRALVLLRRRARLERAEITPAASLGVGFARIEPVAPGLELADHRRLLRTANALRMQRMLAPRCSSLCSHFHRSPRFDRMNAFANRRERTKVPAPPGRW